MSRRAMQPVRAGALGALLLAASAASTAARGGDRPDDSVEWNQFRGPNGQGISGSGLATLEFGPEKNVVWKTRVPPGQSSPAIHGNHIFLTACEPKNWKKLIALCIDRRSGEILWRKVTSTGTKGRYHPMNGPACPTPAVDGERVYVYFPTWGLICYDHGGGRLWERKLETPKNQFGTSASPILYKDKVILLLDGNNGKSRLLALSRKTGETVWERPRPLCKAGWSTPMIWSHDGADEIIVLGYKRLASYDPDTGSEIWYAGGFSPETIGVPVAGHGLLFVSAAALAGRGELKWDTALTWKTTLGHFDRNKDGKIQRDEATNGFKIVLRPDLEPSNPGYGYPMRDSSWLDRDKDGAITRDEWVRSTSGFAMQGKPTLLAVRPGARGDARKTHVAWEVNSRVPESPSVLYCRGRLYLLRDGGRLTCLKAKTGKQLFYERIGASGQYAASPVAAGDNVITASVRGVITVIEMADELRVVAQGNFKEKIFATPALAEGNIYLRTDKHLYAIGK